MTMHAVSTALLYFLLPLWVLASAADALCHHLSRIEQTSGARESLIHLVMLVEMGVPLLAGLLLEINALVIALMIGALVLHQLTALWDLTYAYGLRAITPIEQQVHSVLEMAPLMALMAIIELHWSQFLGLVGARDGVADWRLGLKTTPLSPGYLVAVIAAFLVAGVAAYAWEYVRCRRCERARRRFLSADGEIDAAGGLAAQGGSRRLP